MKTVSKTQHKINKWKYSSRKLSAPDKEKLHQIWVGIAVEGPSRVTIHVHSKEDPLSYPAPRDPSITRCLMLRFCPKKKGPKTLPKTCSPELLARAHSFPEKGFPDDAWQAVPNSTA